jgi:hypothetical protein
MVTISGYTNTSRRYIYVLGMDYGTAFAENLLEEALNPQENKRLLADPHREFGRCKPFWP